MSAASAALTVSTPPWSRLEAKATIPKRDTRPYVGLMPVMPQSAAGCRIEPPVSVPVAPAASASACSDVTETNALSVPWRDSIRPRKARTTSTLENFLARSPAASSVSVRLCSSLTRASLDDLGNQVEARGDLRGVPLMLLVAVLLGHHVRPQPLREPGERVRHREDAFGTGALQGADEIQDLRQTLLVHRDLGRREVEPRQSGNSCDLLARESHGEGAAVRVAK